MTFELNRRQVILAGAAMLLAQPSLAQQVHTVEMLNKDPDDKKRRMIFRPLVQVLEAGDTVRFASVDKGHNTESLKGMLPEGAEKWKSKLSKDFDLTLTVQGFYGYKCTPHTAMGMTGLLIVKGEGMMNNYEAVRGVKHKSRMQKVWDQIWAQVEADGLLNA